MRTELFRMGVAALAAGMFSTGMLVGAQAAEEPAAEGHGEASGVNWQEWKAGNDVGSTASLQRGAANFMNYCSGCHSLKYVRWSRLGSDLGISDKLLAEHLMPPDAKTTDYIRASFPAADAENWFGKQPPDLSLVARARGVDWVYRFLKGFYVDASRPTGTNNLVLVGAAMPAVLSELEGVKAATFAEHPSGGSHAGVAVERFEMVAPGRLTPAEFDAFVRDTVNFLDYVGEPAQQARRSIGLWVVLFLLVFTAFAWMLKKEFWKDVH